VAALVLLAAACGGSPSSTGAVVSSQTVNSQAVAFSGCMRSHGVPEFPDPASRSGVPKVTPQQVGVSDARFRAAQTACASLRQPAQAQQPQIMAGMVNFARCMRAHGIPNWPDPTLGSGGRPVFNLVPAGITHSQTHAPPISDKLAECQRLDPAPAGLESN